MKIISAVLLSFICIKLYACNDVGDKKTVSKSDDTIITDTMKLKITVGPVVFTATLFDNATAAAFKKELPLTIHMKELNENEKYYDLPDNLPAGASNPGTIQAGDLMLYGKKTLVIFYKTFPTAYSYSRIGRINNPSGLAEALGQGDVTVKLQME